MSEINLPQDLAIPLFSRYPKYAQSYHRDTCSGIIIAALFVTARTWKQPRCPSPEAWIFKNVVRLQNSYSVVKNNDQEI